MKVDVLQAENAKFKSKLRWWSNWVDIAIFEYDYTPFLLQMQATLHAVGDLMPMKRSVYES